MSQQQKWDRCIGKREQKVYREKNPVIYFQMGIHPDIAMLFFISRTQYPKRYYQLEEKPTCIQEKL
jgi:hypothetical protein